MHNLHEMQQLGMSVNNNSMFRYTADRKFRLKEGEGGGKM